MVHSGEAIRWAQVFRNLVRKSRRMTRRQNSDLGFLI